MKTAKLFVYVVFFTCAFQLHADPLSDAKAASEKWIAEFNKGNYQYLGDHYTMNAVMITHPIGAFHGRPDITAFWKKLIASGAKDLVYIDPKYTLVNEHTLHVSSKWKMNIGDGYITLEKWIKEADGAWRLQLDDFTIVNQVQPKTKTVSEEK